MIVIIIIVFFSWIDIPKNSVMDRYAWWQSPKNLWIESRDHTENVERKHRQREGLPSIVQRNFVLRKKNTLQIKYYNFFRKRERERGVCVLLPNERLNESQYSDLGTFITEMWNVPQNSVGKWRREREMGSEEIKRKPNCLFDINLSFLLQKGLGVGIT